MKRHARRVALASAVLGAAVAGTLAIIHRGTIRDHVEAWHFQLAEETETIRPDPVSRERWAGFTGDVIDADVNACLHLLSTLSDLCVIVEPAPAHDPTVITVTSSEFEDPNSSTLTEATAGAARQALEAKGWRVIEQRFPQRALVVVRGGQGRGGSSSPAFQPRLPVVTRPPSSSVAPPT